MTDNATNPAASVAGYLCQTTPEQAVKLAMELCEQLPGDPEGFHGGVWPGNVTLDGDGKAVLGMPMSTPAAQRPANQVEYLAPEFFWDGDTSAAADVFSVGLMIYAGCNKGFLPFQPEKKELSNQDRASALRRRMKGQAVTAPEGVSADLKKVLEKALAYKPEDRYITAKELLFALHWTDEALGPEKEADAAAAAAVPAEPVPETAEPAPEAGAVEQAAAEQAPPAPVIEEPPVPEESTEEMLREADQVLAAAAAGLAAAGGAAVAAAVHNDNNDASAEGGEAPTGGADGPAEGNAPADGDSSAGGEAPSAEGEASNGESADAPAGEDAPQSDEAAAAGAAGAAAAVAGMAAVGADAAPSVKKEYKVRKDFETSPDRKAPTVAPARKKSSKAVPVLCGVAAAVLLGGVGYMVFGSHAPQTSKPYGPEATEQVSVEVPPSPLVITPEPTSTAKPTAEPTATPKASPKPTARPDGLVIVTPAPGSLEAAAATGGGTAAGTGGTGGGTSTPSGGAGTTPGGTGSGTGSGGGTSWGGSSGTGAGGGTSWGGGSGTGSGGGTSWGGSSGTGSGGGTSWGGGSGTGSTTTPAPSYTVSPADDTVYITGVGVNVRSGPGTSYPIIGSASTGYQLQRTGISGDWSRVSFKSTTGFVSNTYLSTTDPTATPATPAPPAGSTPEPASRYTVTVSNMSYASAKSAAQSSGGLTVIRSEDDFQSVASQLNNGAGAVEYAWLGVEYDSAGSCWRWADSTTLSADDSHWAAGFPAAGDDQVLLAKRDGSWQYISVSSASFDAASSTYSGKLGYVTGS